MNRPWTTLAEYEAWQKTNCDKCVASQDGTYEEGWWPSCYPFASMIFSIVNEDWPKLREVAAEIGWEATCGEGWICAFRQESL